MPYKDKDKCREYQKHYQRKWREEHKERIREINKKSESRPERKKYLKKWVVDNPDKVKLSKKKFKESEKGQRYYGKWNKNNPDKVKLKSKKYSQTPKGILNSIKKVQKRRAKFQVLGGNYNQKPLKGLIEFVDKRDKFCVYCGKQFSNDKNNKQDYRTYDHLDAFQPHSKTNTVKCCGYCNSSKGDKNVWLWLKEKNLTPSKVIYELTRL